MNSTNQSQQGPRSPRESQWGALRNVMVNFGSHPQQAHRGVDDIRLAGGKAFPVQADTSKPEDCRRLFDEAQQQMGGVDILAANAGIQRDAAFAEMTLEEWRAVLDLNLTGQFLCTHEAVRRFSFEEGG